MNGSDPESQSLYPPDPQRACCVCRTKAPQTQTEYTLIGPKHSWRCLRSPRADGGMLLQWYCPRCWKKEAPRKKATAR